MATPETPDSSNSSNLQTQIGELTDELIRLSLFETAKKFNLSLSQKNPKAKGADKIKTDLYDLTLIPGLNHVEIGWSLDMDAIQAKVVEYTVMRRSPEWGFFGFIKERSFLASDLQLTGLGKLDHMRVSLLGLIWVLVGW